MPRNSDPDCAIQETQAATPPVRQTQSPSPHRLRRALRGWLLVACPALGIALVGYDWSSLQDVLSGPASVFIRPVLLSQSFLAFCAVDLAAYAGFAMKSRTGGGLPKSGTWSVILFVAVSVVGALMTARSAAAGVAWDTESLRVLTAEGLQDISPPREQLTGFVTRHVLLLPFVGFVTGAGWFASGRANG